MKSIEEMNAELRAAVEARLAVSEVRLEANAALKAALDFRGDRAKATPSPFVTREELDAMESFCDTEPACDVHMLVPAAKTRAEIVRGFIKRNRT